MVITTLQIYLLAYMFWRIITYTVENGKPDRSIMENLYVIASELCNTIADLHVNTAEDEALIENTVNILHMTNGVIIYYPIKRRYVKLKNVVIKWYVIHDSENNTNTSSITNKTGTKQYEVYLWFPKNESLMQEDINGTFLLVNTTVMRHRRSVDWNIPFEASEKQSKINETLAYRLINPSIPSEDNLMSWYPKKYTKSDEIDSYSIKKTADDHGDHQHMDKDTNETESEDDDDSFDWYLVNDTHIALKQPNINVNRRTKLIIHGFGADAENEVTYRMALAYHYLTNHNVLIVDADIVLGKIYFKSVKNARLLGKAIADVIIYLELFGADAVDFHLLGVSLGAHVAGWAGQYFRHIKGRRIGRITGLDPAGPCFAYVPANDRLDKSDALYVDVIHTNTLVEGISEPIGHSDFFVNGGGPTQPGCFLPACSHLYAAYVFKLSIVAPELFISVKCDSWSQFQEEKCRNKTAVLGEYSDPSTRGLYYIRTSKDIPFGLGLDGIRPEKNVKK